MSPPADSNFSLAIVGMFCSKEYVDSPGNSTDNGLKIWSTIKRAGMRRKAAVEVVRKGAAMRAAKAVRVEAAQ